MVFIGILEFALAVDFVFEFGCPGRWRNVGAEKLLIKVQDLLGDFGGALFDEKHKDARPDGKRGYVS